MISHDDIKKLSVLARVGIGEKEETKIQHDLMSILEFVSRMKGAPAVSLKTENFVFNVLRLDDVSGKSGEHKESLLKQAPQIEKGFIKVKKVFNDED